MPLRGTGRGAGEGAQGLSRGGPPPPLSPCLGPRTAKLKKQLHLSLNAPRVQEYIQIPRSFLFGC